MQHPLKEGVAWIVAEMERLGVAASTAKESMLSRFKILLFSAQTLAVEASKTSLFPTGSPDYYPCNTLLGHLRKPDAGANRTRKGPL